MPTAWEGTAGHLESMVERGAKNSRQGNSKSLSVWGSKENLTKLTEDWIRQRKNFLLWHGYTRWLKTRASAHFLDCLGEGETKHSSIFAICFSSITSCSAAQVINYRVHVPIISTMASFSLLMPKPNFFLFCWVHGGEGCDFQPVKIRTFLSSKPIAWLNQLM